MKKVKKMSVVILYLTICFPLFFSCKNSDKRNKFNTSSEDIQNEEIYSSENESYDDGIKIVPVYRTEKNKIYGIDTITCDASYYTLKKGNQFIKFNNDENYSDYIPTIWFINSITEEVLYDLQKEGKIKQGYYSVLTRKELPLVHAYRPKIIDNVLLYFNGEKDKISDKDIFKKIDKKFYDRHPNEVNRSINKDAYNIKEYRFYINDKFYCLGYVSPKEYWDENIYNFFTMDDELPEDALIFH